MRYSAYSKGIVSLEQCSVNLRSAVKRDIPFLGIGHPLPQSVAVVAGGPSIRDQVETFRAWDGYIVAINGVHDWLLDQGIVPDAMIVLDPQVMVADFLKRANDETTYLVASCCAPEVFDALEGKRVVMWHTAMGDSVPEGVNAFVWGGPTTVTRAPYVLHMMGLRDIHIFGVDGSYEAGSHAYSNVAIGEPVAVRVGNEVFISEMELVMQAEWLWEIVRTAPEDTKITVHGRGMCPAVVKAKGEFEVL